MATVRLGLILALLLAACSLSPSPSRFPSSPVVNSAPPMDEAGTFAQGGLWARHGTDLFLSGDGGATWQRRTIQANPASVFVLSPRLGWTVTLGPGSTTTGDAIHDVLHIVVNRTTDGGVTWQSTAVDGNFPETHPVVTFADANRGYLVTAPQRFSLEMGAVFRTDDGGASWHRVGVANSLGAYLAAQPGGSALWAGADGWAGGIGPLLLQFSPNGGASWDTVDLPGFAGARSPDKYLLGAPVFLNASDGVLAVTGSQSPAHVSFLRTADGGISWSSTMPVAAANFGSPAIVSAEHWLAAAEVGASIAKTTDAGASWRQIDSLGIADSIMWLGFADALHGAAVVQVGNTPASTRLFVTGDGGATWAPASLGQP